MFTVALIGPDGSGKSTISTRLLNECPIPIQRIYMGINRSESNYSLPTTRLLGWLAHTAGRPPDDHGPREHLRAPAPLPKNPVKRAFKELKAGLSLANLFAEEWYRQLLAWYFVSRGKVVLFDRHFFVDYYHYTIHTNEGRWTNRLHGRHLKHIYPKPDLVIFLDAPAELLYQRKGEGTVVLLEQRRQEYLSLRDQFAQFEIVDASQPTDTVYADVLKIILARRGYSTAGRAVHHG